jgi:hypothetical protein
MRSAGLPSRTIDVAGRQVDWGHLRGQPVEVVRRQIGEDGNYA